MANIESRRLLIALMLALAPAAAIGLTADDARACGQCHGDKEAAVYDHATIQEAIAAGKKVAFADVHGDFMGQGEEAVALMIRTVESVSGIQKGTTKVSSNPTAVFFVFDPKSGEAAACLERINRTLAVSKNWRLTLLKVIGPPETK